MPKKSHTTNPSPARNTPSDIVFDMEDDLGDLRRLGSTLLLISTTEGLEDAVHDALHHVASGISGCHSELEDKFHRLFDQIVRANGKPPEPAHEAAEPEAAADSNDEWSSLYAQWLRLQATYADRQCGHGTDEDGDRLHDLEGALVLKMAATKAGLGWEVAQKIDLLKHFMDIGHDWTDNRDNLLLASIRADVEA